MTPEAKALEIVEFDDAFRLLSEETVDRIHDAITQALRDVERETLERAAKVADEAAIARRRDVTDWTGNEADPFASTGWEYAADEADEIAQSIRALINSGSGGQP